MINEILLPFNYENMKKSVEYKTNYTIF